MHRPGFFFPFSQFVGFESTTLGTPLGIVGFRRCGRYPLSNIGLAMPRKSLVFPTNYGKALNKGVKTGYKHGTGELAIPEVQN